MMRYRMREEHRAGDPRRRRRRLGQWEIYDPGGLTPFLPEAPIYSPEMYFPPYSPEVYAPAVPEAPYGPLAPWEVLGPPAPTTGWPEGVLVPSPEQIFAPEPTTTPFPWQGLATVLTAGAKLAAAAVPFFLPTPAPGAYGYGLPGYVPRYDYVPPRGGLLPGVSLPGSYGGGYAATRTTMPPRGGGGFGPLAPVAAALARPGPGGLPWWAWLVGAGGAFWLLSGSTPRRAARRQRPRP